MKVDVIIPALNEEEAIVKVINDIPKLLVRDIIVVDNGSKDATAARAREAGATVLRQPERGYGNACLMGLEYISAKTDKPDIVGFIDGDYSDYPEELTELVAGIVEDGYDMVLGSRVLGEREQGSLTPQQRFGNWLSTKMIAVLFGVKYTDLGPFRVIRYNKLKALQMIDRNYGWTVEMQVKAAKMGLKTHEIPVRYRRRIGQSKVSGTIKGTIGAGYKIITTILKYS